MKNVKMMLLSLALFAVVGGALAFKAKFKTNYCTTTATPGADNSSLFCPLKAASTTINAGAFAFVATTDYDDNECQTPNLHCTITSTKLRAD